MELVLEQQGSYREDGGGLEGLGWSSREAAGERAAVRVRVRVRVRSILELGLGPGLCPQSTGRPPLEPPQALPVVQGHS